jgi:hypothetical protein
MSASISNTASQRKPFTEDPLIDPKYGSATWRAEQSIIDILQNHLDAHQRNNPGILPNIQILITCDSTQTQGVKQKWIALESLTKYDSTWNISGLRVHDRGAGFNHGFLGLMGASTKEDDPTTRGGLGEGLKMSVAHLLREGCQVRLGSFTPESTWACSPTVRNNSLIFEGRETNNPGKIRGSFTEVVLPKNSKLEATFQKALDSRNGPGLAQYILDFRRQSDGNLDINKDCLVKSFGQSKVYVKGLFVESIPNAIFSYNLGEKWAITGRDRKRVSKEVLHKAIEKELCECSDTKIVEKVVSYIAKHKSAALEHTILTASSKVADNSQDLWRATIEKVFKLEPGKNILVSNKLEAGATNKISELGYDIIFVNAPDNFLDFIDNLYPDKIVTSQKLSTQNHEIRSRANRLTDLASAEMPKAAKIKAPSTRTEDHNRKTPPVALEAEFNKLKDSLAASIRLAMKEGYISTDNGNQVIKRIGYLNCDYKFSNSPYPIINLDNIHQLIITFCQEDTTPEQRLCAVSKILTASSNSRSEDAYTQNMADCLTVIPPLPAALIQTTAVSNYQNMSSGFEEKRRLQSESDAVSLARAREAHAILLKPNATLAELLACREALRDLQPYKNFLFRDGTQTKSLNIKEDNQYTISDVEPYTIPDRELRSKHSSDISFIERNIHPSNPRWIANDFDLINTEPITTNIPLSPVFLEQQTLEQIREFLKNLPPLPQIDMELSSKQHPPITENTIRAGATRCLTFEKEPYSFSITAKDPATAQTKEYQIFSEIIDGEISFIVKGDDFYKRIFGRSYINVHDIANINFAFQVVSIQSLKHDLEISFLSPNGYQDSEPLTLQNALATDPNKGTTFLKGKIDILYGQQCWDDATRLILDTIQNHMDANKGLRPSLKFTVHNKERETRNISEQELALLDDSWQISQFALQDEGKGFSTWTFHKNAR